MLEGYFLLVVFFFSSRRRHTRWNCDWSSDVCSSDLLRHGLAAPRNSQSVTKRKSSTASIAASGAGAARAVCHHNHHTVRSEERRVGKECRSRRAPYH